MRRSGRESLLMVMVMRRSRGRKGSYRGERMTPFDFGAEVMMIREGGSHNGGGGMSRIGRGGSRVRKQSESLLLGVRDRGRSERRAELVALGGRRGRERRSGRDEVSLLLRSDRSRRVSLKSSHAGRESIVRSAGGRARGAGQGSGRGEGRHSELTTELVDLTTKVVVLANESMLFDLIMGKCGDEERGREAGERGRRWRVMAKGKKVEKDDSSVEWSRTRTSCR